MSLLDELALALGLAPYQVTEEIVLARVKQDLRRTEQLEGLLARSETLAEVSTHLVGVQQEISDMAERIGEMRAEFANLIQAIHDLQRVEEESEGEDD